MTNFGIPSNVETPEPLGALVAESTVGLRTESGTDALQAPAGDLVTEPVGDPLVESVDVLVVGAGIAGIMAALSAAERAQTLDKPCTVALVSNGKTFSGSSFSSDTWGLGLIAPLTPSAEDVADLVNEICDVGCGVADRALVESFVQGIHPALQKLESYGVELFKPKNSGEREFIPCFDSKHRLWRGFESKGFKRAIEPKLDQGSIVCHEEWELVDLLEETPACDQPLQGALFFDHQHQRFVTVRARSVVLATGGFANLFLRALGAPDNMATTQAISYKHGADLVNFEFMQIMPAMTGKGEGRVFNEKMFRFAALDSEISKLVDMDQDYLQSLLDERGGYGPFTTRLQSRAVDFAMAAAGDEGLRIHFQLPEGSLPEFAHHYFKWLEETTGLTAADDVRIVPYAHAANGGIRVDCRGVTGKAGLFAAGEVTGGMHGADRIGGLASANALVFGIRAGSAAADYALSFAGEGGEEAAEGVSVEDGEVVAKSLNFTRGITEAQYQELYQRLQRTMTDHCLIIRTEAGLRQVLTTLSDLEQACDVFAGDASAGVSADANALASASAEGQPSPYEQLLYLRLNNQILTARLFATSALERTESCGSHYRADEQFRKGLTQMSSHR